MESSFCIRSFSFSIEPTGCLRQSFPSPFHYSPHFDLHPSPPPHTPTGSCNWSLYAVFWGETLYSLLFYWVAKREGEGWGRREEKGCHTRKPGGVDGIIINNTAPLKTTEIRKITRSLKFCQGSYRKSNFLLSIFNGNNIFSNVLKHYKMHYTSNPINSLPIQKHNLMCVTNYIQYR